MKKKTMKWLVCGIAGLGMMAMAEAAQESPRRGQGHGECINETCRAEGQQARTRLRQGQRRGAQDGQGPGRRLQQGQGQGQGRGQGQGEGQFRQGEGQQQGWHRDGTGARKSE